MSETGSHVSPDRAFCSLTARENAHMDPCPVSHAGHEKGRVFFFLSVLHARVFCFYGDCLGLLFLLHCGAFAVSLLKLTLRLSCFSISIIPGSKQLNAPKNSHKPHRAGRRRRSCTYPIPSLIGPLTLSFPFIQCSGHVDTSPPFYEGGW